ncbi:zinc ABC transporter substrate-binding protein ZnuA [Vibrio tetraodonis]|uniref:zinc ABC transporter substrate-binding protein ZnuA n=1 Tax=Vibrio tetraodonis TaxID=2231647 RepID=UPI000E0C2439|nr:zinc ABC transporter substrate-binding protein ZnuA [Vibrio tetraodonis]
MKYLAPLLSMLLIGSVNASQVLTSIKPIQMISFEITRGVSNPEVLLDAGTSPHDYALKPSDVKRLKQADLVVWYGHDLEPFLAKVLEGRQNILTISEINDLDLRAFAPEEHHHDGHDHGSHDPHVWLGLKQSAQIAKALSERLALIDPENKTVYQSNYQSFVNKLEEYANKWRAQLDPVKEVGYYVFHDAYGYFEQDYSLNHIGEFTVSPERKPGAKTLIDIKTKLSKGDAKCVFSEPQFSPAVIDSVLRGSVAKKGELDPLGTDIKVGPDSYFVFIQSMADSFVTCLSN